MKKSTKRTKRTKAAPNPKKQPLTIEDALLESARTIAARLAQHGPEPRALALAAMFAELCVGIDSAPDLPRDVSSVRLDANERAAVRGIVCGMWRELIAKRALTPERASILARRIAELAEPVVCFLLAHEARSLSCGDAARTLSATYAHDDAAFARAKVDRSLFAVLNLNVTDKTAAVKWHADGHLSVLACGKRTITLDARPGSGAYREEGKRGGYGYAITERYERGAARGTMFSPWHDGEDYVDEKPWLVWVTACAVTVLSGESD